MARRPVWAAETRSGDAHHAAPHDDEEDDEEREVDERAVARSEGQRGRLLA